MQSCTLCPNACGVNRELYHGACGADKNISIAKYSLHYFEEPVISGKKGSGTVFFTGCSLRCAFCQNYELSRAKRGKIITPNELADIFKELEDMGANNINLVTPTHYVKQIVSAFEIYRPKIPVVYNTHGYETIENLKIINPYVDVYLPDLKFIDPAISKRYTGKEDYFLYAEKAIKFMMEAKPLKMENELIKSGVIVRHLILPLCSSDSVNVVKWFSLNQKNGAHLSIMSQYTPMGDTQKFPELKRKITAREYNRVIDTAIELGVENAFIQDKTSADEKYIPTWDF